MICTFFGHRDAPKAIEPILQTAISDLIEHHSVELFYIGNQGTFDEMVRGQLSHFEKTHRIHFFVVLAYLPQTQDAIADEAHTLYPEGLELVPARFAIDACNRWMLEQSGFVVTYVRHETGGAARFKQLAERKGKTVFAL